MSAELQQIALAVCAAQGMQLLGKVGEGAYKETFQVIDHDGGRRALKVYKPGTPSNRTERELAAMLRCNHPNVAKLHSIARFVHGSGTALTTLEEFLPGGQLPMGLSREISLRYGTQLINAVAHIAANGLIHRDLKPENILFRDQGETPVIVDFGLVRDLSESSITPTWLPQGPGTPFYSSPEQLNNEKHLLDWRCDQFSLGVVFSLATLGIHPYAVDPSSEPWDAVSQVAVRNGPSKAFRAAALNTLPALLKMVAPWPVERYRTTTLLTNAWDEQNGG